MIYNQPTGKQYLQNNRASVYPLGNLWSTLGMDFQSSLGVARVSPRLKLNTGALQGCPTAAVRFGQRIFIMAGTTIYRNTNGVGLPNDPFVADNSTSFSTDYVDYGDLCGAWNVLYSTSATKLRSLSGASAGTWSDRATITTGIAHKLCYFKKFDRLYFTDQTIKSLNEANTVATSGDYTLPGSNASGLVDMRATSAWIWIATKTESVKDEMGEIWQWDGISAQITNKFNLPGARAVVKLIIDPTRDIPMALSDKGILYEWNGGGFSEAENGRLPYGKKQLPYMGADPTGTQAADRFVHPNGGYFTLWNTVRILVNGVNMDSGATQNENLPSGVWEWDRQTGFSHVGMPSYDPISDSITDFGQQRISKAGVLADMNVPSATAGRDGTFLAGATYYTDASSTASGIFYDNSVDTIVKKGYMVSDWVESDQVADKWDTLFASYRRFLDSGDSIVPKVRFVDESPAEATITWTSTTTFTVANSAVVVSDYWTSGTGGEVEVLNGKGGSLCAHITGAVLAAGTWTVTIDEAATGATSGTAKARFQKWTKLFPANSAASPANWAEYSAGTDSQPRAQLKLCFTFTGVGEFYKGVLRSNEDIKANK